MQPHKTTPYIDAIKSMQRATWSAGDYSVIGTTLQMTAEWLCEAVDVAAGERVLDVAAGSGNAALAAARRGAEVTAGDYVLPLLERARGRAAAEGLIVDTREADAEALPFRDGTFDVVLSSFGVMFTPQHERAASELLRVCRAGGRIGLASWTPDGFVGQMLRTVARHVAAPAGIPSPLEWGTEPRLAELFDGNIVSMHAERRHFVFRYRSARHWFETFRDFYGPLHTAHLALNEAERGSLEKDLISLANAHNTSSEALRVPSEYLEAIAVKAE